ncbi:hypothetical protein H9Q72_005616 [Fusarium xylarioides]|uniref:Uncharacterized protein n=1 Tax=Fusarium xylarioides TaxID=221167 RepID=A0A9P7I294_9HYPO|nr:hypothetical protein H9Q70_000405 [Fusarium xylarioides]KAG5766313.1 hypothetical protein H9Q72_005616 [Fusarium xylarioides]KAG5780470.1 hypothetical protein H9Q73_005861 [Fusarium xylarioides]
MATSTATIYNQLPTLDEADKRFAERDEIFAQATRLLAEYGFTFGLCLIHAHCTLADNEIMLAKGNVSQPEKVTDLTEYYPERWLPSGEPYEFTTRRTTNPPVALVKALHQLTNHIGVLGLYHIDKDDNNDKVLERTEGRRNILSPYTEADEAHEATQVLTAWNLGSRDPVTMACNKVVICDSRTTRAGAVHKGMSSCPCPTVPLTNDNTGTKSTIHSKT